MSNTEFLNYIDIGRFKCFSQLRVDKLERVNLIGGDNNIGKTAFLEICYINSFAEDVSGLFTALTNITNFRTYPSLKLQQDRSGDRQASVDRKKIERVQNFSSHSNLRDVTFTVMKENLQTAFTGCLNTEEYNIDADTLKFEDAASPIDSLRRINFLSPRKLPNVELAELFDVIQLKNKEEDLYKSINFFDPRVTQFKIISSIPSCYIVSENQYDPLNSFGEGMSRFIAILCALWASENGQLFLDEVENGIHYTKYEKLWELIFTTSRDANCQVFATTHSKECIEAFNRIQFETQFKEAAEQTAYFAFARNVKNKTIFVSKRDKERLHYATENNMRFRGE